jgi:hypothetical protein
MSSTGVRCLLVSIPSAFRCATIVPYSVMLPSSCNSSSAETPLYARASSGKVVTTNLLMINLLTQYNVVAVSKHSLESLEVVLQMPRPMANACDAQSGDEIGRVQMPSFAMSVVAPPPSRREELPKPLRCYSAPCSPCARGAPEERICATETVRPTVRGLFT